MNDLTESEQEGTADKCFDPGYILTRKMAFFPLLLLCTQAIIKTYAIMK